MKRSGFHLHDLRLDRAQALSQAEGLLQNSDLKSAKVRDCFFEDGAWKALCEALVTRADLKKMRLDRCVGVELGRLGECEALEELFLVEMAVEGVAEVVECANNLTCLRVWYCTISEATMKHLGRALRKSSLRTLAIFECSFLGSLASEIMLGPALTEVVFYYCPLGDAGALAVAGALEKNKTITALTIVQCGVGYTGCAALAKALKRNSTLALLNLSGNKIHNCGIVALADMLKSNSSLTTLIFVDRDIGFKGLAALLKALAVNKALKALEFSAFSPLAHSFMDELLHVNGSIINLKITNVCCKSFNSFNARMHKRARKACVAFILCWKMRDRSSVLSWLSKELVVPIAKMICATKGDLAWRKKSGYESRLDPRDENL